MRDRLMCKEEVHMILHITALLNRTGTSLGSGFSLSDEIHFMLNVPSATPLSSLTFWKPRVCCSLHDIFQGTARHRQAGSALQTMIFSLMSKGSYDNS